MKRALLASAALSFVAVMAPPRDAAAQMVEGLYVGGLAGVTWLSDTNAPIFPPASANLSTPSDYFQRKWDPGFAGVLNVGYGLIGGLRGELEAFYRVNDAASGLAFNRPATGGTANSYGLMANVYYDLAIGGANPVAIPYIGGGLGYAWTDWSSVGGRAGSAALNIDGSDGTWAYQAIAGVAFPIPAVPGLAITAEYRYFGTFDNPSLSGTVTGPGYARSQQIPVATSNHNVMVGVRFNFGRIPAPAPVPAAAPAPARTFMVFFDWNRADLTDRARQIIAEAAQARSRQQVTRIDVTGHTDTSGSAQYNQGLSVRRANAVAAELVRLGVPRNEITARGVGESQLLVATPDNTREPQNRRVEIVLR
ncbi:OmpA family protein [Neoroseomonas oryzicola]|uniref:OmpA family protein n=1 Tax=Neoroseomonas oryzicola TaxID=535904 RepID=A0A9X9WFY1_9PROT|nr:OmpA family protein [Neoroseomonas oryzicola]MBR0659241.1 OmpA family protein [Neoroseomonas oryzicola]NKE15625.1 OmpA family protein [Neoroseomonas oryzicola]